MTRDFVDSGCEKVSLKITYKHSIYCQPEMEISEIEHIQIRNVFPISLQTSHRFKNETFVFNILFSRVLIKGPDFLKIVCV